MTASLKAIGHHCVFFQRNDMSQRDALIGAIGSGDFEGLLTWQRFYPMQTDLIDAVDNSSLRTVYMDYGFTPHYQSVVFDTQGENATSSWRKLWVQEDRHDLKGSFIEQADSLIQQMTLAGRRLTPPRMSELRLLMVPFVFIPLQRPQDSVIRYDSKVDDFGHLVRKILSMARGQLFVVCKTHPLDSDVDLGVPNELRGNHIVIRSKNGPENESVCDYLLSRAAITIGINSNMLFRSLLFGAPTVATGEGWHSESGAMHEVDGVEGLNALQYPPLSYERQKRYVATCLERQLSFHELGDPQAMRRILNTIGIKIENARAFIS